MQKTTCRSSAHFRFPESSLTLFEKHFTRMRAAAASLQMHRYSSPSRKRFVPHKTYSIVKGDRENSFLFRSAFEGEISYAVFGCNALPHAFLLQDKRAVYLERLYVLQQRLARNPLFSRPVFGDLSARDFVEVKLS